MAETAEMTRNIQALKSYNEDDEKKNVKNKAESKPAVSPLLPAVSSPKGDHGGRI